MALQNLHKRLNDHNSLTGGSSYTNRLHLMPWGLLGYVTGFPSQQAGRNFETAWQHQVAAAQQRNNGRLNVAGKFDLVHRLIYDQTLTVVKTGSLNDS